MRADEHYARIKGDLERLQRSGGTRADWLQLSVRLLESMMKCQQILIELQKELLALARGPTPPSEQKALRQESKDVILILDQLAAMHQRIKQRL